MKFNEALSFPIMAESLDNKKRTVAVIALRSCVSANKNYYSPEVVQSATGTLMGKPSFEGHDDRTTRSLIGRITRDAYRNGKLFAWIKISKAHEDLWTKIREGMVGSVSIAADGDTRRIKLGDKYVNEVTGLSIKSVDFVVEGSVPGAGVVQVFEDILKIPEITEVCPDPTKVDAEKAKIEEKKVEERRQWMKERNEALERERKAKVAKEAIDILQKWEESAWTREKIDKGVKLKIIPAELQEMCGKILIESGSEGMKRYLKSFKINI